MDINILVEQWNNRCNNSIKSSEDFDKNLFHLGCNSTTFRDILNYINLNYKQNIKYSEFLKQNTINLQILYLKSRIDIVEKPKIIEVEESVVIDFVLNQKLKTLLENTKVTTSTFKPLVIESFASVYENFENNLLYVFVDNNWIQYKQNTDMIYVDSSFVFDLKLHNYWLNNNDYKVFIEEFVKILNNKFKKKFDFGNNIFSNMAQVCGLLKIITDYNIPVYVSGIYNYCLEFALNNISLVEIVTITQTISLVFTNNLYQDIDKDMKQMFQNNLKRTLRDKDDKFLELCFQTPVAYNSNLSTFSNTKILFFCSEQYFKENSSFYKTIKCLQFNEISELKNNFFDKNILLVSEDLVDFDLEISDHNIYSIVIKTPFNASILNDYFNELTFIQIVFLDPRTKNKYEDYFTDFQPHILITNITDVKNYKKNPVIVL